MSKSAYARVAITLPMKDLAAADRAARDQDRSRSWIIAEAVRVYTAASGGPQPVAPTPGLGPYRLAQLEADLRLTPSERVRAAEKTARAVPRGAHGRVLRVVAFDRYEDYLDWKQRPDHAR